MEHDNVRRMYTCMCNCVTMLHSRKLTEQCKPAIMEKSKNNYISKKQKLYGESSKNLKEKYHFIQWFHFWEMKMESQIAISTPIGTTASLTISKVWKQPKLFINRWMDKENVCTHTHTHTHTLTLVFYSALRKKEILPFATIWMDLKGIMLSEIIQTKRNTIWYHLLCGNLKSQTHRNRECWLSGVWEMERGGVETMVKGYRLPAIKWICARDLMCSMVITVNNLYDILERC